MALKMLKSSLVLAALVASPRLALAQQPVATSAPGTVLLEWTTESEVNLAGFNIYRSNSPDGPYAKLNETLIPASPDPVTGGSYSYTDSAAEPGVTYYYKLEDVELDGTATKHGPIEGVGQANVGSRQPYLVAALMAGLALGLLGLAGLVAIGRRKSA
jgi:hypothetical protein